MQDEAFSYFLFGSPIDSEREIEVKISELIQDNIFTYNSNIYFIIETLKTIPIGLVMYTMINWKSKNLCLNVVIGEKEYQDSIYGVDAYLTAVNFAFNMLNMHKILGYINEYNTKSIRITEKGGAKRECILRDNIFTKGKYYDLYIYGLLKEEYLQLLEKWKTLKYWKRSDITR